MASHPHLTALAAVAALTFGASADILFELLDIMSLLIFTGCAFGPDHGTADADLPDDKSKHVWCSIEFVWTITG